MGIPKEKRQVGKPTLRWEVNINMDSYAMDCCGLGYGHVSGCCEHSNEPTISIKCGESLE
jgi:hypothetical protein